jgi:tetratricopeptide (TPR) repeat protein
MANLNPTNDHKLKLEILSNLLQSDKLSEISQGIDQAKEWLERDKEDREIYGVLLDAVQNNLKLRNQVSDLFSTMIEKGSSYAGTALSNLPTARDMLIDADDAYYAGAFRQAAELYRKVLSVDPDNVRAKEQLEKTTLDAIELDPKIPKEATQFFRKARSYIAAKDFSTALKLLNAAIESAAAREVVFSDAEQLLVSIQNLSLAQSFIERARVALEKKQWREALEFYARAIPLDPTNENIKLEYENVQALSNIENDLQSTGILRLLTNTNQAKNVLKAARKHIRTDISFFAEIEHQINQILMFRLIIVGILVVILGYFGGTFIKEAPEETEQIAVTATFTLPPVSTPSETVTPSATYTTVPTTTETPTAISTDTIAPTPTLWILGSGYINLVRITARNNPNGSPVDSLEQYQIVLILEQKTDGGSTWYRCSWNKNGEVNDGWILGEYITLGLPPTPTP